MVEGLDDRDGGSPAEDGGVAILSFVLGWCDGVAEDGPGDVSLVSHFCFVNGAPVADLCIMLSWNCLFSAKYTSKVQ